MGIDEFKTITNVGEGTYSEKRSKFLAFSHHVAYFVACNHLRDVVDGM